MYCHKFTVGFIHVVGEGRFEIFVGDTHRKV